MDKRYFLILIIIGVCFINLYMIANVSDVVGSASANVGKYTFSLPQGFILYEDHGNDVLVSNPDSNMDIRVYTSLGKGDTFPNKIADIKNSSSKILSNGTIDDGGIIIQSVYYQNVNGSNRSTFYFTKDNNNFRILLYGFDYNTQKNETIAIVSDIANSMRINHQVLGIEK